MRVAPLTVLALSAVPALADPPAVPQFIDETATAGITSVYKGEWQFMVGGGIADFDCSGDQRPDLYLAGGEAAATLYLNTSATAGPLSFRPIASGAELDRVTGAYPLDIDSDGILDLVILRSGENVVMRGLGDCRFERANEAWGFQGGDAWSTAFAATWEKGQTWPTLAIGNYIDRQEEAFPWGSCTDNWLHRPQGRGFAPPLPLKPSFCALSMLFTDWNNSGQPSLRVSNDREYYKGGTEQMWHLDPLQPPRLYTAAEGWKHLKIWGMGIASADLTGDGLPDYFLTSMADSKLQVLAEGPDKATFKDVAFPLGAIAQRPYVGDDLRPSTGWHAQIEDVNSDGRPDIFVAKGNVSEMPDFAQQDPNNLMLQAQDGTFVEAGDKAGLASMQQARGAALVDLNADGQLDLVVVNRNARAEVWRNSGKTPDGASLGHWLQLDLHQPGTNRNAIGAVIEVKVDDQVQRREVTSGGGHASGHLGFWHFGLGQAKAAEVRIIWPDGTLGAWTSLSIDKPHVVTRE